MNPCYESTMRAMEDLEAARTTDAVWAALTSLAADSGLPYIAVLKLGAAGVSVAHTNVPASLVEEIVRANETLGLELSKQVLGKPYAFAASEVQGLFLTADQRRLYDRITRTLGVEDALIVPIQADGQVSGVAVLMGSREAATTPIVRSSAHFLVQLGYARAATIETTPFRKDASLLSPREIECLRLSAQGKTDLDIGRALTISPRTARFHIENAKRKLGVATRVQAVAAALRLKAIAA